MKKILSLVLFLAFLSMDTAGVLALNLSADTPVLIQSEGTYTSDSLNVGNDVDFSVVSNVISGNKVVIKAGTPVSAKVVKIESRRRIGRPGIITLGEFYTKSVNGEEVPLAGGINKEAKSKMALSITLSAVVIPLFLLMHGKEAQIDKGTQYTMYPASGI